MALDHPRQDSQRSGGPESVLFKLDTVALLPPLPVTTLRELAVVVAQVVAVRVLPRAAVVRAELRELAIEVSHG